MHTLSCLSMDRGRPSLESMSENEKKHHLLSSRCSLCGLKYQEKSSTSSQILRPCIHHNHLPLLEHAKQTASLCQICNIHTVSMLHKKVAQTLFTQAGNSYDSLLISQAIILYGKTKFPVKSKTGATVGYKPLISFSKILLRDMNSILSIEFKFACLKSECKACKPRHPGKRQPSRKNQQPSCIFARRYRVLDVYLISNCSLDAAVTDLTRTAKIENVPIKTFFPHTYTFAEQLGLSPLECERFSTTKQVMPFKEFVSCTHMMNITNPPPRSSFVNELSNTTEPISQEIYENFVWAWKTLKCRHLLDIQNYYVVCDCLQLCDNTNFLYQKIFRTTNLWPGHFATIAQLR